METLKQAIERLKSQDAINKQENVEDLNLKVTLKVLKRAYSNILINQLNKK